MLRRIPVLGAAPLRAVRRPLNATFIHLNIHPSAPYPEHLSKDSAMQFEQTNPIKSG
jgi:hypothetical protein